MTVEHDLRAKGGMARHLDGEVSPVGIHDVKGVVVNKGPLGLQVLDDPLAGPLHLPERGHGPTHQHQEHAANIGIFLQMCFGDFVLSFFAVAIDDGHAVRSRPATHPAAEAPRHPHQVCIVQFVIGTVVQPSPPGTKATRRVSQPKVAIQNDTIDTVVAAIKQIRIVVAEFIGSHDRDNSRSTLYLQLPRQGPLFGAQSPKSVASYFKFYNQTRPHQSLDGKTPDEVYFGNRTLLLAA